MWIKVKEKYHLSLSINFSEAICGKETLYDGDLNDCKLKPRIKDRCSKCEKIYRKENKNGI
jgi:hypothetical protein